MTNYLQKAMQLSSNSNWLLRIDTSPASEIGRITQIQEPRFVRDKSNSESLTRNDAFSVRGLSAPTLSNCHCRA